MTVWSGLYSSLYISDSHSMNQCVEKVLRGVAAQGLLLPRLSEPACYIEDLLSLFGSNLSKSFPPISVSVNNKKKKTLNSKDIALLCLV